MEQKSSSIQRARYADKEPTVGKLSMPSCKAMNMDSSIGLRTHVRNLEV